MTAERTCNRRTALLLLDLQRDFLEIDGRLPVSHGQVEPLILAANDAIDAARDRGWLVVRVGNEFRPTDTVRNFFRHNAAIADTPGADWDDRVQTTDATYVPKWRASAFCNPDLGDLLETNAIERLVVAGLQARACVMATTKDALRRGYEVQILTRAVACRTDRSRERALRRLASKGAVLVAAEVASDLGDGT